MVQQQTLFIRWKLLSPKCKKGSTTAWESKKCGDIRFCGYFMIPIEQPEVLPLLCTGKK